MRWKTLAWIVVAVLVLGSARAPAVERGPLPDVELVRPGDGRIRTAQLAREGPWLLVYVQPECRACERILKTANPETHPELADRVVIVVGSARPESVEAIAREFPALPARAWLADPGKDAFKRLRLPGVPVVIGMRGRTMEWTLSGVIADGATIESVLTSWMGK
jgi:hypothetical protein